MNTNRISGDILLNDVIQINDKYVAAQNVKKFEKMFGIHIKYLDLNREENKNKKPLALSVSLNVDQGGIAFNSEKKTLLITGEYTFIDGLKKFEIHEVHPDSQIQLMVSVLNKDEVRNYLGQTNTIRKVKDE